MLRDIVQALESSLEQNIEPLTIQRVSEIMSDSENFIHDIEGLKDPLPYGRYLLHQDPKKRFHIELHIFSPGYGGAIHCHRTWGIHFALQGNFLVRNYDLSQDGPVMKNALLLSEGGASCFCPPDSDWHLMKAAARGPQPISLHIYGENYNLEVGEYLDEDNLPQKAPRGAWGDQGIWRDNFKGLD